jgi:hypothetical protein
MCARIYLVIKTTTVFSPFNSMVTRLKCEANHYQFGSDFVIKAELKTNPYIICFFWLSTSIFVLGHMVLTLEKPFQHDSGIGGTDLITFVWYT